MRRVHACLFFASIVVTAACGRSTAVAGESARVGAPEPGAAREPGIDVGAATSAPLAGIGTVTTWPLAGTMRGELRATLRTFADGKQTELGAATFVTTTGPVAGTLLLLVRDANAAGAASGRSADVRILLARDAAAPAGASIVSGSTAPTEAVALPATAATMNGTGWGARLVGEPGRHDTVQLWWERYGDEPRAVGDSQPWAMKERELLRACTGGVAATVLTLELLPDSPNTPRAAK